MDIQPLQDAVATTIATLERVSKERDAAQEASRQQIDYAIALQMVIGHICGGTEITDALVERAGFMGEKAQKWQKQARDSASEIEQHLKALEKYGRHTHPNCHDLKEVGSAERNGCLCGFDTARGWIPSHTPSVTATHTKPAGQ